MADVLYLLCYPGAYAGLALLVRARVARFTASAWLDGAIAAATAAAVISAVAFETILDAAPHSSPAALATTMAYPLGDMILVGIVACAFGLAGWRSGRGWLLLGVGFTMWAIADTGYSYATATGTYVPGGVLDSLWLVAAYAIGCAAWQPLPRQLPLRRGVRLLALPAVFGVVSLGVLVYAGFHHVGAVGVVLASAAVLLVIARATWTFRENVRLLVASHRDAVTDALTGLGNRRQMQGALDEALADGHEAPAALFAMFDLDGFKAYNDRFGHLAGDTLLAHLGIRLRDAVGGAGMAYRPGGDEFCVLMEGDLAQRDVRIAAALAALTAVGDGYSVTASYGTVAIPSEAATPIQALRIADDRMYAQKGVRRGEAGEQMHDVLLGLLRERQPELHNHLCEVGRLAVLIGRRLGMATEQLDELRRAAELHDIGKAGPGPGRDPQQARPAFDDDELTLHAPAHDRRGADPAAAAPALVPVAALVRSSFSRVLGWNRLPGWPGGPGDSARLEDRVRVRCL